MSNTFSSSYPDDTSLVFDAETVSTPVPDEVPSEDSKEEALVSEDAHDGLQERENGVHLHENNNDNINNSLFSGGGVYIQFSESSLLQPQQDSRFSYTQTEEETRQNFLYPGNGGSGYGYTTNQSSYPVPQNLQSTQPQNQTQPSYLQQLQQLQQLQTQYNIHSQPQQLQQPQPQQKIKKSVKNEIRWHEKFTELCEFRILHGHTNVPQQKGELGTWVATQRKNFKKGKTCLTPKRIKMLESIGFLWYVHNYWIDNFEALKSYKAKHGHTNVIFSDGELGKWVRDQRSQYSLLKRNKKSSITEERIRDLESIGFSWDPHADNWNDHFNELIQFKTERGHVNVPCSHKRLGGWAKYQRSNYRLYMENRQSSMTHERVTLLEKLGFCWY